MSADNWANCPRCAYINLNEIQKLEEYVKDSYGKVNLEDYELLVEQLADVKHEKAQKIGSATFREDYEFYGAETGTLQISYRGQCTKCGLSHKIHEERVFYP